MNEVLCPVCHTPKIGGCRCPSWAHPHTLDQLRKGHGLECANGHLWNSDDSLAIDASTGEQLIGEMMTTSSNIAAIPTPFAMVSRGNAPWPYGKKKMVKVDEIKPKKKTKTGDPLYYGQAGMLRIMSKIG